MLFNGMVLLVLLCLAPRTALSTVCRQGDTTVTIHVTAEFFQRALSRSPSSQKTTEYSRQFSSKYDEYYTSLSKSHGGTQKDGSPIPVAETYQPFSASVAADIHLVARTARSQASTDTIVGPPVGSSVIVTEIDQEFLRRTEISLINEYHPGFLQMVRRLTYYVNIGGKTATLKDETLYSSVPIGSSINFMELNSIGKNYILEHYGDAGGEVLVNSFLQTKCYSLLTEEETDRVTRLEEQMLQMVTKQESNSKSLATQDLELNKTIGELASQNDILTESLTSLTESLTSLTDELVSMKDTLATVEITNTDLEDQNTAQNTKIAAMESTNTAQNTKIATLENKNTAQNTKIATLESTSTAQNSKTTALTNRVTGLENKQTKIINPPTGSLRSAACIVTCAGSTGAGSTDWLSGSGWVGIWVDISSCGFVSTPVITASVEGTAYHYFMTQAVGSASSTRFAMNMFGWVYMTRYPTGRYSSSSSHTPATIAASSNWNVNWSATGYTC